MNTSLKSKAFLQGYLNKSARSEVTRHMKLFDRFTIDFPEVLQSTHHSCGAASLTSVLIYYGEDVKECDVMKECKTTRAGTNYENMIKVAEKHGLKVDDKVDTVAKIKSYTDKKIPVIVAIQAWSDKDKKFKEWRKDYSDGHYCVCIGVSDKNIYFEDPSISNTGYMSIEEFENRWHDKDKDGKIVAQLGLAIYGKSPKFKSDLAIKVT